MKNKPLFMTLLLTAALSSLGVMLKFSFKDIFGSVICFPFEQVGLGLRWLSLLGRIQNVLAIVVYLALCLSPLLPLLLRLKKKTAKAEDSILAVMSLLLLYVLYMMINPGLIPLPSALGFGTATAKAILCGTVYSVIVTYCVLCTLRIFFVSETEKLYKYMVILLFVTAVLFTVSIFGVELNGVLDQISSIKTANLGSESGLGFTYLFAVIKFLIDNVASVVSILVTFSGITFITELSSDPYSEETVDASEKLLRICKNGLIAIVCSSTALNLLQLLFMSSLRNINSSVQIPLFSVVFVLGVLILSKMIMANKSLKDDNDSII